MGSCMEQAPFCSMLARECDRVVISVDYRMGPKYQFPAAIEDGEDILAAVLNPSSPTGRTLRTAINHKLSATKDGSTYDVLDSTRISLSGFSSGGNLALNLALSIHESNCDWPSLLPMEGSNMIPLLLFFPSFDQTLFPHERKMPEHLQTPEGAKPSRLKLSQVLGPTYLSKEQQRHIRACPGLANMEKGLHSRAKIFLVLPEVDSLGPQSEEWVKKMEREGRADDLHVERCLGMKHGWTQFPDFVLDEEGKKQKYQMFTRAVGYLNRFGLAVNA